MREITVVVDCPKCGGDVNVDVTIERIPSPSGNYTVVEATSPPHCPWTQLLDDSPCEAAYGFTTEERNTIEAQAEALAL